MAGRGQSGATAPNHYRSIYRAALVFAYTAYGASLFLPGIFYKSDASLQAHIGRSLPAVDYGFQILEWGPLGLFTGNFAWLANPIGLAAFCIVPFSGWRRPLAGQAIFALLALLLGLDTIAFSRKPLDESGGNWAYVDHLGTGFYLWESAFLLLAVAVLAKYLGIRDKLPLQRETAPTAPSL